MFLFLSLCLRLLYPACLPNNSLTTTIRFSLFVYYRSIWAYGVRRNSSLQLYKGNLLALLLALLLTTHRYPMFAYLTSGFGYEKLTLHFVMFFWGVSVCVCVCLSLWMRMRMRMRMRLRMQMRVRVRIFGKFGVLFSGD